MRSADRDRRRRHSGSPTRKLDIAGAVVSLLNIAAIVVWPSRDTVPFHLIAIGFVVLYGLHVWPAEPLLWSAGIVLITTLTGLALDILRDVGSVEEMLEVPLLAAMLVAVVWHANLRITADRERRLTSEKNARLLAAQRRFLQDASHHLRTPITIALTHAELLARDLTGQQEWRDAQVVVGEMNRLRRLSERLLVIAAADDPDFLRSEPVVLDEFAMEVIERWRPTAKRRWKLERLDAATVRADAEHLALAVDALLENAVRHTSENDVIALSVINDGIGTVRLIVGDTGSGIPADELSGVFDRFRTGTSVRGSRGTGLGLALVRAVADGHGGSVRVRSMLGEGSEFEIRLPAPVGLVGIPELYGQRMEALFYFFRLLFCHERAADISGMTVPVALRSIELG